VRGVIGGRGRDRSGGERAGNIAICGADHGSIGDHRGSLV
jgi:hypothetical protein